MDFLYKIENDVNAFLSSVIDIENQDDLRPVALAAGVRYDCSQQQPLQIKIANDKKFRKSEVDLCINVNVKDHQVGNISPEKLKTDSAREFLKNSFHVIKEIGLNDQKTEFLVKMNREKTYKHVMQCVCTTKEKYGHARDKKSGLIFLNTLSSNRKRRMYSDQQNAKESEIEEITLDDMRLMATTIHLRNLYKANGVACHILDHKSMSVFDSLMSKEFTNCSESCENCYDQEEVESKVIAKCKESSYWKTDNTGTGNSEVTDRNQENKVTELDLGRYITDLQETDGIGKFDKGIKSVKVLDHDEKPMPCLVDVFEFQLNLKHALDHLEKQKFSILHITPTKRRLDAQLLSLLWRLVGDHSESLNRMMMCCFGPCSTKIYRESDSKNFKKYLGVKCDEIREAYISRYGAEVQGKEWEQTIQNVSMACIKFDILSFPMRSKIEFKMNCGDDGDDSNSSRESLFVLYNYSRLCNLLKNYEKEVEKGNYKPLPKVEDVDFSNLKEETEWRLFVKYVLQFPLLVNSFGKSLSERDTFHIDPNVNKVCSFLTSLARDLSSYYHQTKVLLDPREHLFPLMFARIYLVIAIKQVMLNAFDLIGVIPPIQM